MFNRVLPSLKGAAIALTFMLLGFAQASDASDADDHNDNSVATVGSAAANDADFSTPIRTDLEAVADVNRDNSDVIEEIVVIGTKKSRRRNLGYDLGVGPLIRKPSQLDWQLFPVYDPERAPLYISHYQIDDQIRRAGLVEVFRIRFGG